MKQKTSATILVYALLSCVLSSLVCAQQSGNTNIKIQITEKGIYIQNKFLYGYDKVWDLSLLGDYLDWDTDGELKDYGYTYFKKPGFILRILEMFPERDRFRVSEITIPLLDEEPKYARYGFAFKGELFFNSTQVTGDSNIIELLDCIKPGIKLNRLKKEEGFREYRIDFTEKSYMTIRVRNNPRAILSLSLHNEYRGEKYKSD